MKKNYHLITLFLLSILSTNIWSQSSPNDIIQSKLIKYNIATDELNIGKQKDFELFQIDSVISSYPDELMTNPQKLIRSYGNSDELETEYVFELIDGERTNYQYNDDLQKTEKNVEVWQEGEWVNDTRLTYVYGSDYTEYITENWENDHWEYYSKSKRTYDNNNNALIEFLYHYWVDNQWENYLIVDLVYNDNSLLEYDIAKIWEENQWVNADSTVYEHDANGNLISADLKLWIDNEWVNWSLNQYAFNADNREIMNMYSSWDGNIYFPHSLDSTEYTESGMESVIKRFTIAANDWQKHKLIEKTYDENNSLTDEYTYEWENEEWVNAFHNFFEFEEGVITGNKYEWLNGDWALCTQGVHLMQFVFHGTSIYGSSQQNSSQVYYSQINVGTPMIGNESEWLVYPNPAKESIIIKASEDISIKLVEILNVDGKLMLTKRFSSHMAENRIQMNELPNGLYFVKLYFKDKVEVRKIIVEN
jgi:hypothetical protein